MQKKMVLLIGGSQVLMNLTKKILERTGFSVRYAVGIAGAREQLMDISPDGIILENDLPDGKGLDFCRELRIDKSMPIMFLSNVTDDELPALQAGASDFLKKPYDMDVLIFRIGNMLQTQVSLIQPEGSGESAEQSTAAQDAVSEALGEIKQVIKSKPFVWLGEATKFLKKKRKFPQLSHLNVIISAATLTFVVVSVGIKLYTGNSNGPSDDYIYFPGEQIPLSSSPYDTIEIEEDVKTYLGTEYGVWYPSIGNITIPADNADVTIFLLNPTGNTHYLSFEIILTESEDLIYKSGLIAPGMYLDEITLTKGLEKGIYSANVRILAYEAESFEFINGINVDVYITSE